MKRFQITEAEYEAIKAKESATKDKNISRRLRVLMLRYEGKKVEEIGQILHLNKGSIATMCRPVSGARLGRVCAQQVSIP